ncbi:hypothetical protein [Endothiovibrio diazotrophicus]|jgi:hypothetical protein
MSILNLDHVTADEALAIYDLLTELREQVWRTYQARLDEPLDRGEPFICIGNLITAPTDDDPPF